MSIPRIIHYCYLSDDPVPEKMKQYVEGWKRMLPDYEFVKWDLKRFKKGSSAWVSEAVDLGKYAFASDYIRLYAVYRFGGIYLDMDVEVLKPFDDLLGQPYMFAYESSDKKLIEAGCFGAEKHDPFIKACLAYYKDRHFLRDDGTMDIRPLSKVMGSIMRKRNIKLNIYPWEYFTAKSFDTGIETPGEKTYAVHHFAASWKSRQERRIIKKARRIRNACPGVGKYAAFVYEKTFKAILLIKSGGLRELCYLIKEKINDR